MQFLKNMREVHPVSMYICYWKMARLLLLWESKAQSPNAENVLYVTRHNTCTISKDLFYYINKNKQNKIKKLKI